MNSPDGSPGRWTALHAAMAGNHGGVVRVLLRRPNTRLEVKDDRGRTPLHTHCDGLGNTFFGCMGPSVLPLYLADPRCTAEVVNTTDNNGQTALMLAVHLGRADCVQPLREGLKIKKTI